MMLRKSLWRQNWALLVATTGSLGLFACQSPVNLKGVAWQDIKSWRAVGTRWAEALDAPEGQGGAPGSPPGKPKTIAVYDLSYPALADTFGAYYLGTIGAGKVTAASLIAQLKSPPPLLDDGSAPPVTPDQIQAAIHFLEQPNGSKLQDQLPPDWWQQVKWKAHTLTAAPESFSLADLDWEAMAKDKVAFRSKLADATSRTLEAGEAPALGGPDFLSNFRLRRDNASGGYQVFWEGHGSATPTRPKKVLDLTNAQLGWYEQLEWSAISELVGDMVGLIPIPVASGILQAAVGYFFSEQSHLLDAHLAMFLEELSPSDGTYGLSPFLSDLDAAQARTAGIAATYSTSGEITPALWFTADVAQIWSGNRLAEDDKALHEAAWLRTHAGLGNLLGARNALVAAFPGIDGGPAGGTRGIAAIAYQPTSKNPAPLLAIDYDQPDRIFEYRVAMTLLSNGVGFATGFIPFAGSIVDDIFNSIYMNPIQQAVKWENRLKAELESRSGEDWSAEIDAIDRQAINPFELNRAASADLIARRKKWLGLGM